MKLDQQIIESEGFEFKDSNNIRSWYEKFAPEKGGNWYGYSMHDCTLIHDPEMEWLKIEVDFSGDKTMDTLFEGYCPDVNTFYDILKQVRMK